MGSGQGGVKGLSDLYGYTWYSKVGKQLVDQDIVSEEDDGLGEDRVIMVEGQGDDPFIKDGVGEDVDQQNLPWVIGRWKRWMGISLVGVLRIEGIVEWGSMLHGTPYILYQLELSMLLLDCFCMSFQSGEEFCSSHAIRALPCQETTNQMLELVFRVYHNT